MPLIRRTNYALYAGPGCRLGTPICRRSWQTSRAEHRRQTERYHALNIAGRPPEHLQRSIANELRASAFNEVIASTPNETSPSGPRAPAHHRACAIIRACDHAYINACTSVTLARAATLLCRVSSDTSHHLFLVMLKKLSAKSCTPCFQADKRSSLARYCTSDTKKRLRRLLTLMNSISLD